MGSVREATVQGFNTQLEQLQERLDGKHEVFVTLTQFNGQVRMPFFGCPVRALQPMTLDQYRPNGSTAFYDAVSETIDRMEQHASPKDGDVSYLVIALTDGEENASRHTTARQLRDKVTRLQNTGKWTFTVLGANVALDDLADTLNLPHQNLRVYTPTAAGVAEAFAAASTGTDGYLTMREQGMTASNTFYNTTAVPAADGDDSTIPSTTAQESQ